jgi:hypothetical protein
MKQNVSTHVHVWNMHLVELPNKQRRGKAFWRDPGGAMGR